MKIMTHRTYSYELAKDSQIISPLEKELPQFKRYAYQVLAKEVSSISRYFDRVINWMPNASQEIFNLVESRQKLNLESGDLSELAQIADTSVILLDGNVNHSTDIQELFESLKGAISRSSRLVAVLYNPYYRMVFSLMNLIGLRRGELPSTFISRSALENLARLSGFEVCRVQPILQFPFKWFCVGPILNSVLRVVPTVRWMGFAAVVTLRPIVEETKAPSLSIVVPARNEAGNIENVFSRLKNLEAFPVEIIFVEGHSKDNTWEQIQEAVRNYQGPFRVSAYQQTGKGKKNAVKEGFERATGDLLTILDADLTMPPEMLIRFYQAYCQGKGDFINGSRLVYPMATGSMQFLNHLGNIFFAKALSFVTDVQLTDSLCGTKLVSRRHYQIMNRWCENFGDFDPFGDFELIFPVAALGLGSIDVPVRYEARTYGTTNISRFQHGWQLLRMTLIGFFTFKMGRMPQFQKSHSSPASEFKSS